MRSAIRYWVGPEILASLALFILSSSCGAGNGPQPARETPSVLPAAHNALQLLAHAGPDLVTTVGLETRFEGHGLAPENDIVRYAWDFEGDGEMDFSSPRTGRAQWVYEAPGSYTAILTVYDSQGAMSSDTTEVTVLAGTEQQEMRPEGRFPTGVVATVAPPDGVVERLAVMINGGGEERFWADVLFMYPTLTDDYGFTADRVYLLNYDGLNPYGQNPEGMIDYPADRAHVDMVFSELASVIDEDDQVFVWVTDHGWGYNGSKTPYYGYLSGYAGVDPGDEQDYLEKDFKLRSLYTGGMYRGNHGMDVWRVYYDWASYYGAYVMFRNKFVAQFANLEFENLGTRSDDDILIERLYDVLKGDTNRNTLIEESLGEVFDFDGDGLPPYDSATGAFDEDDWVGIYTYEDNWYSDWILRIGTVSSVAFFDGDLDGCIDVDINPDRTDFPNRLKSDGEDFDHAGLFDGLDVNGDGDMSDWVSIDEMIFTPDGGISDDELREYLDRIPGNRVSVFLEPCFSGGFIDDLSASNRVTAAATEEETESWGNLFVGLFTSALHGADRNGNTVYADADGNGHVSMMEAFNFAALNDFYNEIPQYDDNADGIGHPYPIPQGGDGDLGAETYLETVVESLYSVSVTAPTTVEQGRPGQVVRFVLRVTNTGVLDDRYGLTVSGNVWPTRTSGDTAVLPPGESRNAYVAVAIPRQAKKGDFDRVTATVTSKGDPSVATDLELTTFAVWTRIRDVAIDVKPGSGSNVIDLTKESRVQVAVLSTSWLDIPTGIVPDSMTFGKTGNEDSLVRSGGGAPVCWIRDMNRDHLPDVGCWFWVRETGLVPGVRHAVLRGRMHDGEACRGRDFVVVCWGDR